MGNQQLRRSVTAIRLVGVAGFAIAALATSLYAQGTRVRTISQVPGVALETRLLSDDEVVIVERSGIWDPITFSREMSKASMIEYATMGSDVAIVIDVDDLRADFTDDRSWIRTLVSGAVREVLMSRTKLSSTGQRAERLVGGARTVRPVTAGERVEIEYVGMGEIRVKGVLVKASPQTLKSGLRYLLFLQIHPEKGILIPSYAPYWIENGRLVNERFVLSGGTVPDPLDGLSLDEVAKEIRRLASE